jgi:SagB-type dehydrogenase family enzyme
VSCRRFTAEPLPLADLATLLDLTYGIHGTAQLGSQEHLERPVPSGGGLYPLEWYVIVRDVHGLPAGVYHYAPLSHALEQLKILAFSHLLTTQLFMNQPYVSEANAILVVSAVVERSLHKYGDRGFRYILLEAGHAAQNVCLVATALGLGALPLGGFFDTYVGELLGIDVEQEPILYALAVGTPASDDRVEVRNITALIDG